MAASTRADLMGNRYGHLPWRRRVIVYSTASTATYQVSPRESGALFYCGTVSTIALQLPKISSKNLGLMYEVYFSSAADVGDNTINTAGDSSASIHIVGLTTGGIGTGSTITPQSTDGPNAIRLTAISSVIWMGEAITNGLSSVAKGYAAGGWTTA